MAVSICLFHTTDPINRERTGLPVRENDKRFSRRPNMPIYEYECESCGIFTELRTISDRNSPAWCPDCQTGAKRVIHSAPGTTWLGKKTVMMHEVNERSRHEPKTLEQYKSSVHGAGCSCCSTNKKSTATSKNALKTGGSRPWMISH